LGSGIDCRRGTNKQKPVASCDRFKATERHRKTAAVLGQSYRGTSSTRPGESIRIGLSRRGIRLPWVGQFLPLERQACPCRDGEVTKREQQHVSGWQDLSEKTTPVIDPCQYASTLSRRSAEYMSTTPSTSSRTGLTSLSRERPPEVNDTSHLSRPAQRARGHVLPSFFQVALLMFDSTRCRAPCRIKGLDLQ
jgi:hypothetical protein